jgi:ADP-heptose:LPS heptosyltransferase
VFRPGQLGDTIAALPVLHVLREAHPEAHITWLSDRQVGKNYVVVRDLLGGSGLVDEFISYDVDPERGTLGAIKDRITLAWHLRRKGFGRCAYLAPSLRTESQIKRDRLFFRLAGIKNVVGTTDPIDEIEQIDEIEEADQPEEMEPFDESDECFDHLDRFHRVDRSVVHEADRLLSRLSADGYRVPPPGEGCMDLGLGEEERDGVEEWLEGLPADGGRRWIGVGAGSKMPAKRWPEQRYAAVVGALVEQFGVWPVVLGGPAEREMGRRLVERWGCGYVAAGELGVRPAAEALSRCGLYLGNDTGTMHLAAAVGTRCVVIFSCRDEPGKWEPYGPGHRVLRAEMECAGCMKETCEERENECLRAIGVDEVCATCEEALGRERQAASGKR